MTDVVGEFGTFVPEAKENTYTVTIEAFAKASEKNADASWTVTIDAAKETVERNAIAEAANAIGKTARLRSRDDSGRTVVGQRKSGNPVYSGQTKLTFTLAPMHQKRRKSETSEAEVASK